MNPFQLLANWLLVQDTHLKKTHLSGSKYTEFYKHTSHDNLIHDYNTSAQNSLQKAVQLVSWEWAIQTDRILIKKHTLMLLRVGLAFLAQDLRLPL